jgi:hypothetical protein
MCVERKTEVCSGNYCCRGKTTSVTHFVCVFLLLPTLSSMQSTRAVLLYHLWPVWLYRIFQFYLINGKIFGEKNRIYNVHFDSLYSYCLKHVSF